MMENEILLASHNEVLVVEEEILKEVREMREIIKNEAIHQIDHQFIKEEEKLIHFEEL